jgi:putative ABC transport system permease protein
MIGQDWAGQPAGHASALLNWSLWQRRYGGNPHLVGKPAIINDKQVTIAGVMPRGFQFPQDAEIWVPQGTGDDTMLRGVRYYQLIGRIRRDVSLVQSQSEMDAICARFRNESRAGVSNVGIRLVPLQQSLAEGSRGALLVLLAAVGFVLLIACANVANLAFARATGRLKEMAVRAAMGAARWRLMRQLVTESLLLAVLGGALGAGLASWTLHLLTATLPLNLPRITPITVDLRVLLFTALLSLGAGLLFGAAPAIGATKIDLQSHLKEGGTMLGHRRDRFRSVLLVSEVALSFVLLTGAGLMIRTLVCLLAVDPGFQIQHILTCEVVLPSSKFRAGSGRAQPEAPRNPVATTTSHEPSGGPAEEEKAKDGNSAGKNLGGQMTSYFERGVDQLTELPGVESVGAINYLPLGGSAYFALPITTDSQRPGNNPSDDVAAFRAVTPAYFSTLRIPLLAGRFFNLEDGPKSTSVVIINQSMARHFWPNQNPVGRQLRSLKDYEVVGVVGDVRHNSLHDPGGMEMYFPARQFPVPWMTFVIRTSGNPKERASAVRAALLMVDRDQPISQIRAMSDVLDASISPERSRMTLMSVFGGLALLMAAVGCYGVIAVSVGQRTHEVGIRVALGARPMDVLRLIVGHGCRLALIGVAIGLAAAFGLTRLIASMLYGVGATDPVTLSLAAAFLTLVAVIASCVPARRAMRVNPIVALRCE